MKLSSPFVHHAMPTERLMLMVVFALLPGIAVQTYFFGYGVLINLMLCGLFAISAEALVLWLRNRPIKDTLKDNSALLSGLLLAVAIPPTLPIWMSFVGVWFAIIFAKQLYGGLGFNPFNPAMVGYVLLLISFPVEMTAWTPASDIAATPGFTESLSLILFGETQTGQTVDDWRRIADGFTMATPLDHVKTELTRGKMSSEIVSGSVFESTLLSWQIVNLGYLFGGLILLSSKVIRWHIPLSMLASIFICASILHAYDPDRFIAAQLHLTTGATMLGAFFIATDPVSASTTPKGRLIYGAAIGFLLVVIRTFGGYPDAVGFAVLLLNLAAPMLDHYTQPVIYGHAKKEHSHDR